MGMWFKTISIETSVCVLYFCEVLNPLLFMIVRLLAFCIFLTGCGLCHDFLCDIFPILVFQFHDSM